MKFKIGDRVRVLSDGTARGYAGKVYTIGEVRSTNPYSYRFKELPSSLYCYENNLELVKERKNMTKSTLRQRVRALLLGEDEKALNKAGFTYKSGALTKEGRKVVLDHIFENDSAVKSAIVEVAKQLNEDACKDKKT